MTIHLISNSQSSQVSSFLKEYLSRFFSSKFKFSLSNHQFVHQEYWTWDELFSIGKEVRSQQRRVSADDFFVVLVSGENEHNWFAAFDLEDPCIGFLQTTGWEKFELNQPTYAIAYHLVALATGMKFFGNEANPYGFYHDRSVGCMFDFTGFKEEVIYKLKSAHICPSCIQSLARRSGGNPNSFEFLKSVKESIENVRGNLFRVDWNLFFEQYDYQVIVNEDLTLDLKINEQQIPLPISKGREAAVFMMLLKHENGLSYQDFEKPQLKREYLDLYYKYFVNNSSLETLIKQADAEIQQKTYKKNLHAIVCKIKRKLSQTLKQYPEIQKQLLIQSGDGPITIPINRQKLISKVPELALVV